MRRKNTPKVDAILTADWHLRSDVPACRSDDFWAAQWRKVDYVAELQREYNCIVLHAGDMFDHWKASPELLTATIEHLPKRFYTVYGNHDLPNHNQELSRKSAIRTLEAAGALTVLDGTHMGQTPKREHGIVLGGERQVVVWHEGVWKGEIPWPNCRARQAKEVLQEFSDWDLIVTGDFHTPCVERLNGRLLVNPGSLMRQTADQIDFRPRVYLYNADENEVTEAFLPIDLSAVSREHLDHQKDRDTRVEAFVARLNTSQMQDGLSFQANMEQFLRSNEVDARTEEVIRKAMEPEAT